MIVLVDSASKMGSAVSIGVILPATANVATEIAAEWVSANPATIAAIATPDVPNHSSAAFETSRIIVSIAPNTIADFALNARPRSSTPSEFWRKAKKAKATP